jgi:hypothetical protein
MREARLQFVAAGIAAHVVPAVTMAGHRSPLRRLAMPVLAASLWIGVAVGSVAAAQAGGPLYSTRMWIERATLPAAGSDRMAAELARLDARLGDALGGAARGDEGAVAAALDAYRQIADDTIAATTGDPDLEAIVGAALDRHQAVLSAVAASLEAKGNTAAAASVESAIQRTIAHNAAVVAGFATNGSGGDTNHDSSGGQTTGSGSGGAVNGGSGSGNGATGGGTTGGGDPAGGNGQTGNGQTGNGQDGGNKPSKAPKPTPTPAATAPAGPDETPDHSPRHPNQ